MPLSQFEPGTVKPAQQVSGDYKFLIVERKQGDEGLSASPQDWFARPWTEGKALPNPIEGTEYKLMDRTGTKTVVQAHNVVRVIQATSTRVELETENSRYTIYLSATDTPKVAPAAEIAKS